MSSATALPASFDRKLHQRLGQEYPSLSSAERKRRIAATEDFLRACVLGEGRVALAPSATIDEVWHEMLMFTADYRAYCRQLGVDFIDHEPFDFAEPQPQLPTASDTVRFMEEHGFDLANVTDLWLGPSAYCSGGGGGGSCGGRAVPKVI